MRRLLVLPFVAVACAALAEAASAQPQIGRTCNDSGVCHLWFVTSVRLEWSFIGTPQAGTCIDVTLTQDTPGTKQGCIVSDNGETLEREVTIKIDQTPPDVTSVDPDRLPDYGGWYTRPVTFTPRASDITSGLASCDSATYGGPDSPTATLVASCRDNAGNLGSRAFQVRYDATPPDPSAAAIKAGDRIVRLSWPAGATATVMRTPGTDGATSSVLYQGAGTGFTDREVRNRRQYRYVLTLTDEAGNAASRELPVTPQRKLLTPARRAIVTAPPLLKWTSVRGARYYNVQLLRNGRKILSTWPKRASLQLKKTWRFHGRSYRLKPGKYTWYVWPGFGPRSERRYGDRIGARTFIISRP
jgi:hypothetical protein